MKTGYGRLLGAQIEVAAAFEMARQAQREADREKRPIPAIVMDKIRAEKQLALGNLEQATAAFEAANRFPPLRS